MSYEFGSSGGEASFGSSFVSSSFSTGASSSGAAAYDLGGSSSYSLSAGGGDAAAFGLGGGSSSVSYSSGGSGSVNQVAADLLALGAGAGAGGSSGYSASFSSGGAGGLSVSGGGAAGSSFLSEIEAAIIRAQNPITINETEEITINGQRGIWANKAEVSNWRGPISISQYQINQDANPEIIRKGTNQNLTYIQELAIKYLRPPTPPAPGEIVITQQSNTVIPPAPPVVIRQQPPRPTTPAPLVIREAPPQAPVQVGRKVITISGKTVPPPPRKVVIERLAPLPNKPQSIFVERWLPYSQVKRRVIFQKSNQVDPVVVRPRNVIVQWEAPRVTVKTEIKNLGVVRANPAEYVQRYGASLKAAGQLPQNILDIRPPEGVVLAANFKASSLHELYGDVQALTLIDLDREGLSAYRQYLQGLGSGASFSASSIGGGASIGALGGSSSFSQSVSIGGGASAGSAGIIEQIFSGIDSNNNGRLSSAEARSVLVRLNSSLGRSYGEDDLASFFARLDTNGDGTIDIYEFRRAFEALL